MAQLVISSRTPNPVVAPQLALGASSPPERLLSLGRQRQTLLRKIDSKQKAVERLQAEVEQAELELARRVGPLADECRQRNAEIWHLFEELVSGAATKRARRAVREVFQALMSQGIVLPVTEGDGEAGPNSAPEPGAGHGGGYSAAPKGAEVGRELLKAAFRRLTVAWHPDRTQDPAEKRQRTALMQRVTHAYQTGDYAVLLRLEERTRSMTSSALAHGPPLPSSVPTQSDDLQRVVSELRVQLSELKQRSRELERHQALQFFDSARDAHAGKSLDRFVDTVEAELEELTRIRDFVAAFRDKKLGLEEFLCGPSFQFGGAEFDFDDLLRLEVAPKEAVRERRRRRGRKKRDRRSR